MNHKLQLKVINSFDNVFKISNYCIDKNYTILEIDGIDDVYLEEKSNKQELGLHFNGDTLTISMGELSALLELYKDLEEFIKNKCDKE